MHRIYSPVIQTRAAIEFNIKMNKDAPKKFFSLKKSLEDALLFSIGIGVLYAIGWRGKSSPSAGLMHPLEALLFMAILFIISFIISCIGRFIEDLLRKKK